MCRVQLRQLSIDLFAVRLVVCPVGTERPLNAGSAAGTRTRAFDGQCQQVTAIDETFKNLIEPAVEPLHRRFFLRAERGDTSAAAAEAVDRCGTNGVRCGVAVF